MVFYVNGRRVRLPCPLSLPAYHTALGLRLAVAQLRLRLAIAQLGLGLAVAQLGLRLPLLSLGSGLPLLNSGSGSPSPTPGSPLLRLKEKIGVEGSWAYKAVVSIVVSFYKLSLFTHIIVHIVYNF